MISDILNSKEYNSYFKNYIDKTTSNNIIKGLKSNLNSVVEFYSKIPEEKHDFAYEKGKWTIKDILLHIIDTERIFTYRALRIGRGDQTPMAGFEQDDYVLVANSMALDMDDILEEYKAVRMATIQLFQNFEKNKTSLLRVGEASGSSISVRAIGYIITGHENHHNQIIRQRYLL